MKGILLLQTHWVRHKQGPTASRQLAGEYHTDELPKRPKYYSPNTMFCVPGHHRHLGDTVWTLHLDATEEHEKVVTGWYYLAPRTIYESTVYMYGNKGYVQVPDYQL